MKLSVFTIMLLISVGAHAQSYIQTPAQQQQEFERREFMDQQRLHNERVENHMRQQRQQSSQMPFAMSRPDIGGAIQRGVDQYNRQQKGY
jgi:hypothetical protein